VEVNHHGALQTRHLCPKNQPQRLRIRGGNPSRRHRNREEMYGVCKVVHPLSSRRLLAIALAVQVNRGHNPLHLSNQRGGSSLPGNKHPLHQQLLTMPTPRRPGNKAPVRDRLLVAHRPPALALPLCNQMLRHSSPTTTTIRPCYAHPARRVPSVWFASKRAKNLDVSTRFVKKN